jgi:hypothetical protein
MGVLIRWAGLHSGALGLITPISQVGIQFF